MGAVAVMYGWWWWWNNPGLAISSGQGQANINATFNSQTGTAVLTVN